MSESEESIIREALAELGNRAVLPKSSAMLVTDARAALDSLVEERDRLRQNLEDEYEAHREGCIPNAERLERELGEARLHHAEEVLALQKMLHAAQAPIPQPQEEA